MTSNDLITVSLIIKAALDRAEAAWNKVGIDLLEKSAHVLKDLIPAEIPGHPQVDPHNPMVDDFIAIVADMRGSTQHLLQRISPSTGATVTELQRVFYETSALLPAFAFSIRQAGGSVTEYLGDGVLGFFQVLPSETSTSVYAAHSAAEDCLQVLSYVVNPEIKDRYGLPAIEIGVGLAYSKAIVTTVGLPPTLQAKAFGKCVFHATKLSAGPNEIRVDECLKQLWPKSKTPTIFFEPINYAGSYKGYIIKQKENIK